MLGNIISIIGDNVRLKLSINIYEIGNIIGKNVIFDSANNVKIVGEVKQASSEYIDITLVGEITNNYFIYGNSVKPSFNDRCRIISLEELNLMYQNDTNSNSVVIGSSMVYSNYKVSLDINKFFSNHFAILGNSGSGKSYSTSKILQSVLYGNGSRVPYGMNIFLFDAYGEYHQALKEIGSVNSNLNYRVLSTDINDGEKDKLRIPFWLLGVDDIALLLDADNENQIPIIEKALKLVAYFTKSDEEVLEQKNDILARSILDIIFSGKNPSEIRNKLTSVLTKFNTTAINLEVPLTKGGWTRTIRQCLNVESSGKLADVELVITYLEEFTKKEFQLSLPDGNFSYGLEEFSLALEFALISEGILTSNRIFDYANVLKTRLNTLINGDYADYFKYPNYVSKEEYIKELLTLPSGGKVQVVDFNINYVDDRFAKTLVKIYAKLLFDYSAKLKNRGSMSFHILLEEAHRYVQEDIDKKLFGYNIFERIAKEGRKYGTILGLISQRPSELSETAISQCTNFLVFKMFNADDLAFVNSLLPNINSDMISKLKSFHSGICIAYGTAFKMPVILKVDEPNPAPYSQNIDVSKIWY